MFFYPLIESRNVVGVASATMACGQQEWNSRCDQKRKYKNTVGADTQHETTRGIKQQQQKITKRLEYSTVNKSFYVQSMKQKEKGSAIWILLLRFFYFEFWRRSSSARPIGTDRLIMAQHRRRRSFCFSFKCRRVVASTAAFRNWKKLENREPLKIF